MTDLHLALLVVAGVVLVLLVGYNKWQERRMLRAFDATLHKGVGDPLMRPPAAAGAQAASGTTATGLSAPSATTAEVEVTELPLAALYGGRIEPRLGVLAAPGDEAATTGAGVPATVEPKAAAVPGAPRWVEDPMLDWVLELRCAHAVDGVAVFDAAAPLARMESALPVFLVAWDARAQQWVEPNRFGFYSELLVATQLARRGHRLDEIGASRFVATVQQVALALDADFDAPEVGRAVELANELDRLCARIDVQIGITLQAQAGPWEAARIAQAAGAAGMVGADGRWELLSAAGEPLCVLATAALPTDRLVLELDVPLAPVAAQPLQALFKLAQALAADLGARLIDDNGRPVSAASLAGVADELDALYKEMRGAGVEPGGARAHRLFG